MYVRMGFECGRLRHPGREYSRTGCPHPSVMPTAESSWTACAPWTYWLCTRMVDAERVGAQGISQGGGPALVVGALDRRVKMMAAEIPFLSDIMQYAVWV